MDQNKMIEKLVLTSIDTAQAMLDEYSIVVPFGIRAFNDSDDLKMNCPSEISKEDDWLKQINRVVSELRGFVENESVCATALITELQSGDETAIGLQLETELSSVMFVYPFTKENDKWIISAPVKTDQLMETVYNNRG